METVLSEKLFSEILADRQRRFGILPEADLVRSARQMTERVLTGVRQALMPPRQKPITPARVPVIPAGISPERKAKLQAIFADNHRRTKGLTDLLDADFQAHCEKSARQAFSDTGVSAMTIESVIAAIKLELGG